MNGSVSSGISGSVYTGIFTVLSKYSFSHRHKKNIDGINPPISFLPNISYVATYLAPQI
jgi:hypothetical protein